MLLLGSISYSQEDSLSDIEIRDAMIEGAWFHAGTIYTANDSVDTYYREKWFFADSTVYSIGLADNGDTLTSLAAWYVLNGTVRVYSIYYENDTATYQLVDYVAVEFNSNKSEIYLRRDWGPIEERTKTKYARRSGRR